MIKFATITGKVVAGKQLGRNLGFATANIEVEAECELRHGVWLVEITIDNTNYQGIANLGTRPTVDNNPQLLLESHIFDFNQNIYGKQLSVRLLHHIRDEKKFTSLQTLKEGIEKDIETAKKLSKTLFGDNTKK